MAKKKDKKAEASPGQPVARNKKGGPKKEYPEGYVARKKSGKPHPYGGTGEGNPSHRNLKKKCKAEKSNGDPCSLPPMRGQEVCGSHGGKNPQAKANARERLNALADPAAYTAGQLMEHAEDEGVRLRAAFGILDRTGNAPRHALAMTHEVPKYEAIYTKIMRVSEEPRDPVIQRLRDETGDDRY